MDNAYDLKWLYPEVMAGTDMLRLIVESGLGEDKNRRASAIRTFIRAQFDIDEEVRFKQIELQNKLVDLFIDVPIGYNKISQERLHYIFGVQVKPEMARSDGADSLGAAQMLLDSRSHRYFPQIVLEGAPGQGKSTIAQYICQIYRMRILEESVALSKRPSEHIPNANKLPFKVDLRDLATWLNKRNPFASEETSESPHPWAKSLEAFLAAQISHFSGGAEFTVSDLHAIAKLSAILLVLDGLDEVPGTTERKEVITEVIAGVNRLKEVAASLQVLITSRPTIFAGSVGFPEKEYPHFQLLSLSKNQIFSYADQWLVSRRLEGRDAASVRKILRQKIEQPHLQDLAQNPMQLAILLSLIHTRGISLPDKRTALYDNYVDLFFNREAEKSKVVGEHRELLVDLHQYLAWVLHSEAEMGENRGSISNDRLSGASGKSGTL